MTKGAKIIVATIIVLVVGLAGYAVYQSSKKEIALPSPVLTESIRIGAMIPLSGDMAEVGVNAKAAIEIATDEINALGGINGRKLEVVYEDDKCESALGQSIANKFVTSSWVTSVLGSVCSGVTLTGAPIFETAKIPLLSFCSTAPEISKVGDYVFRNVPSDNAQADYGANYIYHILRKKSVALLYVDNDWALGLRDVFKKSFADVGGTIVVDEELNRESKTLKSIASKVKASKAEIIYILADTDESIASIKLLLDKQIKIPTFGTDKWDDERMWQEVGADGDGAMYTSFAVNSTEKFKQKMKAKLGTDEIIYCSNYAYDGLNMLAGIIARVGTDRTAIKDALYIVHYEGGIGQKTYDFNDNGDPSNAVYTIKVIKNGRSEILQMPNPIETEKLEQTVATTTASTSPTQE